jgi:hypothetical protein
LETHFGVWNDNEKGSISTNFFVNSWRLELYCEQIGPSWVFITSLLCKFGGLKAHLKSPKIVVTKYNFLHSKKLTRCVHQTW